MNDVLSSLNIGREKSRVVCCIEGSIANDDVLFAFLHTFTHSVVPMLYWESRLLQKHHSLQYSGPHTMYGSDELFMSRTSPSRFSMLFSPTKCPSWILLMYVIGCTFHVEHENAMYFKNRWWWEASLILRVWYFLYWFDQSIAYGFGWTDYDLAKATLPPGRPSLFSRWLPRMLHPLPSWRTDRRNNAQRSSRSVIHALTPPEIQSAPCLHFPTILYHDDWKACRLIEYLCYCSQGKYRNDAISWMWRRTMFFSGKWRVT